MPTLEQQRAQFAWEHVRQCEPAYLDRYKPLSKGAPALIMNNGLMQALAFYEYKGESHHKALSAHIRRWLRERRLVDGESFEAVMQSLHGMDAAGFRRATEEALELLKWIRQYASAVAL